MTERQNIAYEFTHCAAQLPSESAVKGHSHTEAIGGEPKCVDCGDPDVLKAETPLCALLFISIL